MKTTIAKLGLMIVLSVSAPVFAADPRVDSWFTDYSGKYARLYETDVELNSGTSKTTWTRGTISQTLPAYCGVQQVLSSADWVYIRTSGLGSHTMGPWYLNVARSQLFPNLPRNQNVLYRFPRNPTVPATRTLTGLGSIGYYADGVALFDNRDAFYWNGTAEVGGGTGLWNRDAYINESVTFDPAFAHQEQSGNYHYHANPPALRHLLGDHVDFDPATKRYSESIAAPAHSPILGWVRDGYPIYGPYGYGSALDSNSPVRRMVCGYVRRDGQNGTVNLAATGRSTLPGWAGRAYNRSTTLAAGEQGPTVSTQYPLGRYLEDNEYLGDLGRTLGTDFDLDEFNGRFCITPEFPNGTYAYFISINASGAVAFPYNVGRQFYGNPAGGTVNNFTESVTTNFVGGAGSELKVQQPRVSNSMVTLVWNAVEGGTYRVESTGDFSRWMTNAANIGAVTNRGTHTTSAAAAQQCFRVARTALANYDGGGTTTESNGILSVTPNSGARGTSVTITINLDPAAQPAPPPQTAPVNSVTVGTIAGTSLQHLSQTQVRATIAIPANAATGPQTVTVVFPGPPGNPTQTVTYTLSNGFTIQ